MTSLTSAASRFQSTPFAVCQNVMLNDSNPCGSICLMYSADFIPALTSVPTFIFSTYAIFKPLISCLASESSVLQSL